MVRIKFYSYMVFPGSKEMGDMFRSIDIVSDAARTVAKVFQGEVKYDGDGSECVQYDDVVVFETLSDSHKEAILRNYPYATVVPPKNYY